MTHRPKTPPPPPIAGEVAEIVRLRELALTERATVMRQAEELTRLRAAVERVRALHVSSVRGGFGECDECRCDYPCPTLRALDGEDA